MFTYVVTAEFANDEAREEYLAWMRGGHVAEVVELGAAGARFTESGRVTFARRTGEIVYGV
ncbi:hypothetical protein [Nocardia terpenica]|uniref:DUF4286 family protein n=1 Tax=Nocardia terpenica TaxID=455432 RepID=A0A6G9ZBZ8_9NOCA|nr:hypothetical protein [Nocardia terpenica]QIS22676.1 hypothetical protein F6W96_34370 [Nocardia terpenica]